MRPTLILLIILFLIALLGTGVWFYCLGKGRAASSGHQGDAIDPPIFVLITCGMAFLGDVVIRAYAPVLLLKQNARLLKRRIKQASKTVTENQQQIISVEEQGFWYRQNMDKNRGAHRITKDQVIGERSTKKD